MDEQRKILDQFRGKGWAGIRFDNGLTLSITLTTEEAEAFFRQLYPPPESPEESNDTLKAIQPKS